MSIPNLVRKLFVHAPPDPVAFWRARAADTGLLSVMWRNPAYNELAHRDQWGAIEAHLPERRGAVLDLGCGTGRLTGRLASLFERYVGVDLDTMVDEATRRNAGIDVEFVAASVQQYDYPPASFDLVLSMACLASACRSDELPAVVRKVVDATTSGGRIVLIEPFHRVPALTRTCQMPVRSVIRCFEERGANLVTWSGMHFIPVRLVFARDAFAAQTAVTRGAYRAGELLVRVAPRLLSDYKLLVFAKA